MDNQQHLTSIPVLNEESSQDLFKYYARPLTAKLLETMELSKHFFHGEGDYLYYEKNNKIHKVLDLTGGYGANILGHRHPRILAKVQEWRDCGAPSLTQGSNRHQAGKLAKRLSDTLFQETAEGPWVTTFSNSGTEAVEAAYKHCLIYFSQKLIQLEQELEKEMNQAVIKINGTESSIRVKAVSHLRSDLGKKIPMLKMNEERKSYFLHQIANAHSIEELVTLVREINKKQLSQRPSFISLEKSYHGKTMGALSLTSSEGFRNPFFLGHEHNTHTHFVSQYIEQQKLDELIDSTHQDLIVLGSHSNSIAWVKHTFSLLAGAFVEPIQGEAGIVAVNLSFLANLKKYSLQEDFLLVFDEIQSGMYRTGKLASGTHNDITPDIYTFSKSLGGGIAKIAATTINQRKYIEEFGFLHTSTFSDDDFSSSIALEVLNILQGESSPVKDGMKNADYLWARLNNLKSRFPHIIEDIRGKGLMLAIEFKDKLVEMGFEFKTICDSKMQGYMFASVLLNHEGVRMNPSLSNNLTLRIQPSIYFDIIQTEKMIAALINVCVALEEKNVQYFLSALYPQENIENLRTLDLCNKFGPSTRPLAVFLCHLIDETHVKKLSRALKGVPTEKLLKKLALGKDIAEFEIYHTQTITDDNGVEMDIIMLGVPITSEELQKTFTSQQKYKVVQKVQNAVDYAKELGATTVGLGQFTSIVSGNGLYLNPRGMNLTTGNAFTVALTVQSALRSAEDKKIELSTATAALIGAAGNIMSVATSLMADQVGKILMIHHSPIESSVKYQQTTRRILSEIATSNKKTKIQEVVSKLWTEDKDLISFLAIPEIKEVFEATSDISRISEAEIVLCGASASNGFLSLDLFKQDSVVVDVAVPASIKPEMLEKLKTERTDITYHLGGVAQIPQEQSINFFIFPLGKNECYACMAETFALGFSGRKNFLNIGDLNKNIVLEVQDIAKKVGFVLGSYKNKSSL
jgi:acetylornithine/succinyldiaminopimelate/putrescine aminotransferase/predicted amino acid dehydrogenase